MAKRTSISMCEFVEAHELSSSTEEVARKTGLSEQSVAAKASAFRHPKYKQVQDTDTDGNPLFRDSAGNPTSNKDSAKRNSQGHPVRIMVEDADENGNPIVTRQAIPLKHFARVGSSQNDADKAIALLEKLRSDSVEV